MALTQHVTNQQLSKRLKEIGVPQNMFFHWSRTKGGLDEWKITWDDRQFRDCEYVSAYLASELGEWLPEKLPIKDDMGLQDPGCLEIFKSDLGWTVKYIGVCIEFSDTLPDAMGKMVVYLKENGLIEF